MDHLEDSQWFQDLYERFCKPLVNFSRRAGIEVEISKEIMQQTFFLLLMKYDDLKDRHNNLPGWLIKTNSNLIKQELNSPRRKHEIPLADWLDVPTEDRYHFPLKDLLPAGLTERHQTILILCYEEQLSYREIALRMGLSEGYVGVLLSRARTELKKLYQQEALRLNRDAHFAS